MTLITPAVHALTPAETNHLAKQLLKDYGIDADSLTGGDLLNLINLLHTYSWTRSNVLMSKDFDLDAEQTPRQDF